MRFLLTEKNSSEIPSRLQFLSETFNLWFLPREKLSTFTVFESIPSYVEKDICIIYGHNYEVANLLKNFRKNIHEKNIYIIACFTQNSKDFIIPSKRIFIAPQDKKYGLKLRRGGEFGFDIDLTDTELNLYNDTTTDITKKLEKHFQRIVL